MTIDPRRSLLFPALLAMTAIVAACSSGRARDGRPVRRRSRLRRAVRGAGL